MEKVLNFKCAAAPHSSYIFRSLCEYSQLYFLQVYFSYVTKRFFYILNGFLLARFGIVDFLLLQIQSQKIEGTKKMV